MVRGLAEAPCLAESERGVEQRVHVVGPLRDIAGHSDIAPGRKTDPGTEFRWSRLLADLARTN